MLVLWLVPALVVIAIGPELRSEADLAVEPVPPRFVIVGERVDDGRQAANLSLRWSDPSHVPAEHLNGIVTGVHAQPGQILTSGDPIISVDGTRRIAHVGQTPFYREIDPASRVAGADVAELDRFLQEVGLIATSTLDDDHRTTTATSEAIELFHLSNGGPATPVFRPDEVIYVPEDFGAIEELMIGVGDRIDPGDAVLAGPRHVESATIELTSSPGRQSVLRGAGMEILLTDDESVTVPPSGLDDASLLELTDLLQDATEQTSIPVIVRLAAHRSFGAVPAEALVSDSSGDLCVLVGDAPSRVEPTPVEPALASGGEPGIAYVAAELVGETVWANPRPGIDAAATCA